MTHRLAASNGAEEGLSPNRGFLVGTGRPVEGGTINRLEMDHRLRLKVEQVSGKRQVVDIQPLEVGDEPLDRIQVVDGEDLRAGNPLEMLNDPATGPGGRTRDKDASHPVESREGGLAPASWGERAASRELRARMGS